MFGMVTYYWMWMLFIVCWNDVLQIPIVTRHAFQEIQDGGPNKIKEVIPVGVPNKRKARYLLQLHFTRILNQTARAVQQKLQRFAVGQMS